MLAHFRQRCRHRRHANHPTHRYEFDYITNQDVVSPGSLSGKGMLVRKADGTTAITMSVWLDHRGTRPAQQQFPLRLTRGACGFGAVKEPYQHPYECPADAPCAPAQVAARANPGPGGPAPLEFVVNAVLDTHDQISAEAVWNVHLPATVDDASNPVLSLVLYDPQHRVSHSVMRRHTGSRNAPRFVAKCRGRACVRICCLLAEDLVCWQF
jgi:hypothetical protein